MFGLGTRAPAVTYLLSEVRNLKSIVREMQIQLESLQQDSDSLLKTLGYHFTDIPAQHSLVKDERPKKGDVNV